MRLRVLGPRYGGEFEAEPCDGGGAAEGVRFVLPGEVVETGPLTVIEASRDRVAPGCRHFGVCGGCDYQQGRYAAQLEWKREVLGEALRAAGLGALPEIAVHAGEAWGYRNRIRLRVEARGGEAEVGYNRRGTREFLGVVECPIAMPLLWKAAEALRGVFRGAGAQWVGSVAEVEFQTNGSVVQMTVFTRDGRVQGFGALCEGVKAGLPELAGAGTLGVAAGYGAKERADWGVEGLVQRVGGRDLWVRRGGFFQVNRFLLGELVSLVTGGRGGGLAWDLYAGVGFFAGALAETFAEVVAVESNALAGGQTRKSGAVRAVSSETAAFLGRAVLDRARPELVVMDPPRAGLGAEVCGLLGRIAAREMVYVSCEPTTLARDLALLSGGYAIAEVHLVDLFPQTYPMETVVFLRRRGDAPLPGSARKAVV